MQYGIFGLVRLMLPGTLLLHDSTGLEAVDPLSGKTCWRRQDVPFRYNQYFGDAEYIFVVEQEQAGDETVPRRIQVFRTRDGGIHSAPDLLADFKAKEAILGRMILVANRDGPNLHYRLIDGATRKLVWEQRFPADCQSWYSSRDRILTVMARDGLVTLYDLGPLADGRPLEVNQFPHLRIDPRHLLHLQSSTLLIDPSHIYIALETKTDRASPIEDGPHANYLNHLNNRATINGNLYTFDRQTGQRRWISQLPHQMLLLHRFAELPFIFCAASWTLNPKKLDAEPLLISEIRVIDKATGKHHLFQVNKGVREMFHEVRVNPASGIIQMQGDHRQIQVRPGRPIQP